MITDSKIVEKFDIKKINRDESLQTRVKLNQEVVNTYAEDIKHNVQFPPIVVFQEGDGETAQFRLADGWHRLLAYEKNERLQVPVDVHQGSRRDALLYACKANAAHGLQRSSADKKKIVETFLRDPEWQQWTNELIAQHAYVDPKTVGTRRKELEEANEISVISERKSKRNDKTTIMKTANIGKQKRSLQTEEIPAPSTPLEQLTESEYGETQNLSTDHPLKGDESDIISENTEALQQDTPQVLTPEEDDKQYDSHAPAKPLPEAEQENTVLAGLSPDNPESFCQVDGLRTLINSITTIINRHRTVHQMRTEMTNTAEEVLQVFEQAVNKAEEILKPYPLTPP